MKHPSTIFVGSTITECRETPKITSIQESLCTKSGMKMLNMHKTCLSGWCSTPTLLLICSSFSRENGYPFLICSSLSTAQLYIPMSMYTEPYDNPLKIHTKQLASEVRVKLIEDILGISAILKAARFFRVGG